MAKQQGIFLLKKSKPKKSRLKRQIFKYKLVEIYSRSKRANFLSTQIVAKGKNAASTAKTVSSSSQE